MARWKFRPIDAPTGFFGPAVYKVRLLVGDQVVSIPRFLRPDSSGILQIGVTKNLESRRRRFEKGLAVGAGHSEANLLHILERRSKLLKQFPGAQYQIAFQPADNRRLAVDWEENLIKAYLIRFGEVPPLNSAIPSRYG